MLNEATVFNRQHKFIAIYIGNLVSSVFDKKIQDNYTSIFLFLFGTNGFYISGRTRELFYSPVMRGKKMQTFTGDGYKLAHTNITKNRYLKIF